MAHPAKFSSKLISKIYGHIKKEGWANPGDTVLDPFAGVALGALDAMRSGLKWRGVELEPRFVDLGKLNISFWNKKFNAMPSWSGDAEILEGDSRKLQQLLVNEAQVSISSPPFLQARGGMGQAKGEGPIDQALYDRHRAGNLASQAFGTSKDNLGNMKESDSSFEIAVSSPPYANTINADRNGIDWEKAGRPDRTVPSDKRLSPGIDSGLYYGDEEGQLGKLRDVSFEVAVSSPPYEGGGHHNHQMDAYNKNGRGIYDKENSGYGEGDEIWKDFWVVAREIIGQVFITLNKGGHAIWVVKDYVKDKKRVPFSDQWRLMCESVGFVTIHEHRAMLVRNRGVSLTLEGGEIHHQTSSKSFFRRLAEKKGSPAIDWETIWCMEKP